MTIDEAIVFCETKTENIKLKAEPQTFIDIAEWLEELKWIKETSLYTQAQLNFHKELEYNKAIDDYCNRMCDNGSIADFMKDYFRDVAKELKEGVNNDKQ